MAVQSSGKLNFVIFKKSQVRARLFQAQLIIISSAAISIYPLCLLPLHLGCADAGSSISSANGMCARSPRVVCYLDAYLLLGDMHKPGSQ